MIFPSITREGLSAQQGHRCCYCGCELTLRHGLLASATREHIIPRSHGGPDTWENLVAACLRCNNVRGTMDAMKFFLLVQETGLGGSDNAGKMERRSLTTHYAVVMLPLAKESRELAWQYHERTRTRARQT